MSSPPGTPRRIPRHLPRRYRSRSSTFPWARGGDLQALVLDPLPDPPVDVTEAAGLDRPLLDAHFPADLAGRVAIVISALFQGMVRQRRIDPANVQAELYGDALRWLFTGLRESESGRGRPAEPGAK